MWVLQILSANVPLLLLAGKFETKTLSHNKFHKMHEWDVKANIRHGNHTIRHLQGVLNRQLRMIRRISMRIVLSGGGTAGHIYPALAVADTLKRQGHDLLFVGTPQGLEARLVPSAGIDFVALNATGFNRSKPWTLLTYSCTPCCR